MSVFTRERADKYDLRPASISNTLFGALVWNYRERKARSRGEPDPGCGSSNDLFHFIKFMWEFLHFIYLFVLGSKSAQCYTNITFVEQFQFTPHLQPLKGVILFWKNIQLIRRKILLLTEKQNRQGSPRVEVLGGETFVALTRLQAYLLSRGSFTGACSAKMGH